MTELDTINANAASTDTSFTAHEGALPDSPCDVEKYRPYLSDYDLTDQEAEVFILTLWRMMSTMVDIGMGLEPVQLFLKPLAEENPVQASESLVQQNNSIDYDTTEEN